MRPVIGFLILAVLAGCGADGAPTAPAQTNGISTVGEARVGVVGSF